MTRRECMMAGLVLAGCGSKPKVDERRDIHSYSRPQEVRVKHMDLDLEVDFDRKEVRGTATHTLVRTDGSASLVLDTYELKVEKVETAETMQGPFQTAQFVIGEKDAV